MTEPADGLAVADEVVRLAGITVAYGPTVAVDDLSLSIRAGDVLGLVGANGAGKSTLMRVLCGAAAPDAGTLSLAGAPVDFAGYRPREAHRAGVRIVWQELSLCGNLTVAENVFVERPGAAPLVGWRRPFRRAARDDIEAVFPGAGIGVDRAVGALSIGERQMVEIARAAGTAGLKLLILDEPTSALDAVRSRQLRDHVRARASEGLAVVFISHKLGEVTDVASRVFVMRNGRAVMDAPAADVAPARLLAAMGGGATARPGRAAREPGRVLATIGPAWIGPQRIGPEWTGGGREVRLHAGEIVGIAGLEGDGQKALLEAVFRGDIARSAAAAYVSGDRQREGVFPLWTVAANVAIGRIARRPSWTLVLPWRERAAVTPHAAAIDLDTARFDANILELSGGNQQKAIAARALATDADILLLEDPTRGVDIATKEKFYRVAREAAAAGKLVLWHSTEEAEFAECDRVLAMGGGRITAELSGADLRHERVLAQLFEGRERAAGGAGGEGLARRAARLLLVNAAILGLVAVCAALVSLNPIVASVFGAELLLAPAVAITFIALGQMFIVGGSEIDLGAGAFAGLVNVLSATLLVSAPALGGAAILAGLLGYGLMAAIVRLRAVPAIVVTLGASFVWYGIGYSIQPAPGGSAPGWLRALTQWSVPGVPTPLVLILAATAVALLVHRSRLGTVLRGFGASPEALTRSGWSALRYGVIRYVIAGAFVAAGGLTITAMNGASDVNAGSGYTLLSVAAVVLGGCRLLGGVISPAGVAAGAVTLSLIGALLGALGVSTDYNAAVQGLLMIAVLGARSLAERER